MTPLKWRCDLLRRNCPLHNGTATHPAAGAFAIEEVEAVEQPAVFDADAGAAAVVDGDEDSDAAVWPWADMHAYTGDCGQTIHVCVL